MQKQPEVRARTRAKFMTAFLTLCEEKNIGQISVGELTRLAGYNRSTFYEYFTDIPDLLRQIEDNLLVHFQEQLPKVGSILAESTAGEEAFEAIFREINEPIYCLLGPHGDPAFLSRLKEAILPQLSDLLNLPEDSAHIDYLITYAYSVIIGLLQQWKEKGQDLSEEELFRLIYDLLLHGVSQELP